MANVPTDLSEDDKDTDDVASLSELRVELQRVINNRIADANQRGVIVFVDDLDRLNPPVAVEILELLKNVFTLDNCIFVLAIDYDVVVKGLEPKYGKLNDKNEREFRSFFDKIIQVPFSLPVKSYKPMRFLLDSLVRIGYLKDIETSIPDVTSRFASVVDSSVGKNPRSIKRLINTLSLLDCIDSSESEVESKEMVGIDDRLLNFIIVAIQICYPKIYNLLMNKPAFLSWSAEFAYKEGITVPSKDNDEDLDWADILEAACANDVYLSQHLPDIMNLFSLLSETMKRTGKVVSEEIGMKLQRILDKSSITGVYTKSNSEDLDKKDLIYRLHSNVI